MRGTVANREVYKSTGVHSEDHAKRIRDEYERKLLDEAVFGKKLTVTFAEAVDRYQKVRGTTNALSRYIPALLKAYGHKPLREINAEAILDGALASYPSSKNTTRNTNWVNPMVTILRFAAGLNLCDVPIVERFPNDARIIDGASPEWIEAFLSKEPRPGTTDFELQTFVAFVTTTGCRAIDALRLPWNALDFERGQAILGKTKNGEPRRLPLAGALLRRLAELPRDRERVFRWTGVNAVNSRLYDFADLHGLARVSSHKVGRHAFAERGLANGMSLKELQQGGGWRDLATVSKRYGHLEQTKIDERMRDLVGDVLRPKLKVIGGGKE